MNYIGSKLRLLDFLEKSIKEIVGEGDHCLCDLFAGTGTVGIHFKKIGYQVTSNDLQYYSYVINKHYIKNNQILEFSNLNNEIEGLSHVEKSDRIKLICDYLNNLPLVEGFIYNNYATGGTLNQEYTRMYFSDENAKICDTIRIKLGEWEKLGKVTEYEYTYLLTCLLDAVDEKANTASVYGAFLKSYKKSALDKVVIKPLEIIINNYDNEVYNMDANELVKQLTCDITYLDPPYNNRVYGDNYHILETIAKYDNPEIKGKTGNRKVKTPSDYSKKSQVKKAFTDMINNCKSKYIFLSYNNEGLLSMDEIKDILSKKGKYGVFTKEYQRYKSDKDENRNHKDIKTYEHLHYVICD
jgi:adenine-specific DNA-methyltransferase